MAGSIAVPLFPADAYYSLAPCFAAGRFVEMTMRIVNLRYHKGYVDSIGFDFELTPIEEEDAAVVDKFPAVIKNHLLEAEKLKIFLAAL